MKPASSRAIVVGGGVIGAACAHYLSEAGRQVTLIERGEFGRACSHANCGLVCPSHVLPLCVPGAVRKTLGSLLDEDSPFSVKPSFDPVLWTWLWKFAARCQPDMALAAGRAIRGLLDSSMALYRELLATRRFDCEWEDRGTLCVYRDPNAWQAFEKTDRLLRDEFGVGAKPYDGPATVSLEPALKPDVAGAWHYEMDAHLRPDRLMTAWRTELLRRGVTIAERVEVRGFRRQGRRAIAVETSAGEFSADSIVVAVGAWTPQLQNHLGVKIPIQPGKGYSITMPRPRVCPRIPLLFPEHKVAATPFGSGYRLGSTMEFAGYDTTINPRRIELLRRGARAYLVEPDCEPTLETWYGWRPMTYDGIPIIDRLPALENVWVAAGHNMIGLSAAPATGKLIAELIDGRTPHLDPKPYGLARFGA